MRNINRSISQAIENQLKTHFMTCSHVVRLPHVHCVALVARVARVAKNANVFSMLPRISVCCSTEYGQPGLTFVGNGHRHRPQTEITRNQSKHLAYI